ncbi:hypothetical protein Hanom_Chr17g01591091 [Helianthus anomalus]
MKYRVPISLWLVENSHRTGFVIKLRFFLVVPLLARKMRKDLSEIVGLVRPRKAWELLGMKKSFSILYPIASIYRKILLSNC